MTPAELIARKSCSGACLTAVTPEVHCRCKGCSGRLHGLAARADLSALLDGRTRGLHRLSDLEVISA